jgi:hypothetical protein
MYDILSVTIGNEVHCPPFPIFLLLVVVEPLHIVCMQFMENGKKFICQEWHLLG